MGVVIVETRQEFDNGSGLTLGSRPIDLIRRLTMIAAGIGLHDARIDREPFTPHQASIHTGPHHRLEQLSKDVAIAEAAVAIHREGRVVRHWVIEIETTEPTVGEMKLDLLA